MVAEPAVAATQLALPMGVVTRADVGRLADELEALDNFLNQAAVKQGGGAVQMPKTSRLFDELAADNKLNMLDKTHRKQLYDFLQKLRTGAPVLHISFNTDPSPMFQQKLMTWIRQHLHPYVLLQIGLSPSIGAGCMLRTTNKFFDFSLRQRFAQQRPFLISKLQGVNEVKQTPITVAKEAAA